jgi:hypothetical protein
MYVGRAKHRARHDVEICKKEGVRPCGPNKVDFLEDRKIEFQLEHLCTAFTLVSYNSTCLLYHSLQSCPVACILHIHSFSQSLVLEISLKIKNLVPRASS